MIRHSLPSPRSKYAKRKILLQWRRALTYRATRITTLFIVGWLALHLCWWRSMTGEDHSTAARAHLVSLLESQSQEVSPSAWTPQEGLGRLWYVG